MNRAGLAGTAGILADVLILAGFRQIDRKL